MLLPEFQEADINLLFHKRQAGYCFKRGLWCIKSGRDRNTNKRTPKDTKQGPGEGLASLPCLENEIQETSDQQPDFGDKSELNGLSE